MWIMKVVLVGKGIMLANLIIASVEAGAEIVGVYRYEYTNTTAFKLSILDFFSSSPELALIRQYNLPCLKFRSINSSEFKNFLVTKNVDIVFVGTWKEKIKKEIYQTPKIGTINVHPSLLPKYRGPNPYLQTILNGEKYSGVTLHLVDEGYDTGAILSQVKVEISPKDTSKELREKTVLKARGLVVDFLNSLNNQIVTPIKQNDKASTYFPNITGEERMLDFKTQTSEQVSRTVRALYPFLPTYITYKNRFYIVNPYKFEILSEVYEDYEPNDFINVGKNSMTIVCSDKKAIKFDSLKRYSWLNKFFK